MSILSIFINFFLILVYFLQAMDIGRERDDKGLHHELDKEGLMGLPPGLDKSGIANYVPSQRLEWKRY